LYLVVIGQRGNIVMFDLEIEIIQWVAAHEHTGDVFLMIEQFGKRPWITVWNFRCADLRHQHIAKKAIGARSDTGLVNISKLDDLLQAGTGVSLRTVKVLGAMQFLKP